MRTLSVFIFAVLAVLFAFSVTQPIHAQIGGSIIVAKATTNGDTTTIFHFTVTSTKSPTSTFDLTGGSSQLLGALPADDYTVTETIRAGWYVSDISCHAGTAGTTFSFVPGLSAIIHLAAGDSATCTFTNSPVAIPEYPLGLPLTAIFMIVGYGLIKRRTRNPEDI